MVTPPIVITVAVVGMTAPAVVMMKNVAVVELHEAVSAETLLDPATTVGVTDAAKKSVG